MLGELSVGETKKGSVVIHRNKNAEDNLVRIWSKR
jgi:hypothetical protein